MSRSFLDGYTAPVGRFDEMLIASGSVRPGWSPLLSALEDLPPEVLRQRSRALHEAIVQDGVTYTVYADPQGNRRPWELDMLPHLLSEEAWAVLATGIAQRARLLNSVLSDLYGQQQLIADGYIPPALIFGQKNYLWPCRGIRPPGDVFLHVYAADIARSPDGRFWVIADRTQGPSGAGYAWQNRQMLGQALPEILEAMQPARLGLFFQTFKAGLEKLAPVDPGDTPVLAVLTPGPYNETYFEHAFLARQLNIPLVEGNDLTVRNDRLYLKTLRGLKRVHVLLRRLDDDFCDPLELRADSALGIPGLLGAVRAKQVLVANALGSGVLESGALAGFLPALSQRVLGESLMLPSVATWWCGEQPALETVLRHINRLVIKPAFSSMHMDPVFGHTLSAGNRQHMIERLHGQPHAYAAQEWVRLSQTPVMQRSGERRLSGRSLGMRLFAVYDGEGNWQVMPGGLGRVSPRRGADIVTMQHGGASKDIWVINTSACRSSSSRPSQSLYPVDHGVVRPLDAKSLQGRSVDVPSRIGENLFWMGRYTERMEANIRLLRAGFRRLEEMTASRSQGDDPQKTHLALLGLAQVCAELYVLEPLTKKQSEDIWLTPTPWIEAVFEPRFSGSLTSQSGYFLYCVQQAREQLSQDNWQVASNVDKLLKRAWAQIKASDTPPVLSDIRVTLDRLMQRCTALSGFAMDDMTRDDAWVLLMIGRTLERIAHLAGLFSTWLNLDEPLREAGLGWVLESANSVITYRARYHRKPESLAVLYVALFDHTNPHALAFQFDTLARRLTQLTEGSAPSSLPYLGDRLANFDLDSLYLPVDADAVVRVDHKLAHRALIELLDDIQSEAYRLSDALGRQYFTHATTPVTQGF